MKINNLSSVIAVLNNKTMLQKELVAQEISTKNSIVSTNDIRDMLINLNFQLTDLNLDIAKRLLKHRMSLNKENMEVVIKTLKQLDASGVFEDRNIGNIMKELGSQLAIFLLERNIKGEPEILELMLKLMLREVQKEDVANYKELSESSNFTAKSFSYNYYPLNLELKGQRTLFLELFILPEPHTATPAEKDSRIVFCVDSEKLGLIKFDLSFGREKFDLKLYLDREDLLGYIEQNISVLTDQLNSLGHKIGRIDCRLNKQNSFTYVESLLELPKYKLDARV